MGWAKNRMMELDARGYGEVDEAWVCSECFSDEGMQAFIANNATHRSCSYCDRSSNVNIAAHIEDVIGHIVFSIGTEWYHPEDSGTPYETREGGWQGDLTDIEDILLGEDSLGCNNDELFKCICEAIYQKEWMRFFSMPHPEQESIWTWLDFCEMIKHKVRYFFVSLGAESETVKSKYVFTDPREILASIKHAVDELGLVKDVPVGSVVFRARLSEEKEYSTARDLGAPPKEKAKYANRMSPAGIPMFYGAYDCDTAISEIRGNRTERVIASVGEFETLRSLRVVDLCSIPEVPSLYDEDRRHLRVVIKFIMMFVNDFVKRIDKDGRHHIEYVPTQVVTEFFRHVAFDENVLDGVLYDSSVREGGVSVVLFIENDQAVDVSGNISERAVLRLRGVTHDVLPEIIDNE